MKTTYLKTIEAWTRDQEAESHGGNLKSQRVGDKLLLIGYNWAVYGYRWHGQFYLFPDWHGYSSTTSKHVNAMHREASIMAGPAGVCINQEGKPSLADMATPIAHAS